MKRIVLFAAVAGLGLVSAAPPSTEGTEAAEASGGYPPCSATVTDRCIQTYEGRRSHRRSAARAIRMAGERG